MCGLSSPLGRCRAFRVGNVPGVSMVCGATVHPRPCGRQRFNVLGALNAITHELIAITNETYITSKEVCELLQKYLIISPLRCFWIPTVGALGNACYQKYALVIETAARLHIELCFLPSYSPNLNLIERLWRFVKKECLYSTYYPSFSLFKAAIMDCLDQTHLKHALTGCNG